MKMFLRVIDGYGRSGVATLALDSYAPRYLAGGAVCSDPQRLNMLRASADSYAALDFLATTPDIDGKHVFLEGYSHGGTAAITAVSVPVAAQQKHQFAGVIAYYPYCRPEAEYSAPTLILIGDKDDWTPAELCQSIEHKHNVELVVYPGVTHAFNQVFALGVVDILGHHLVYDEAATSDALRRAEAFLARHLD
jgi:dienelactone hydrolase